MNNNPQNREISTLAFNERVLQEAEDTRNPLMERVKFLGIFSSNMDEFFKVRVASVQRRIELGKDDLVDVLTTINKRAHKLDDRFQAAYRDIITLLAEEGIRLITEAALEEQQPSIRDWVRGYFRDAVLPSLVPIILRDGFPFPQLTDGALYFAIIMRGSKFPYALLELPADLPRFVELPNGHIMYIDDVIRYSLNDIFYIFNYKSIAAYEFKISRDAELDIDNDFSEGYVRKMERVLNQRKGGRPTRFVYDSAMPKKLLRLLQHELKLDASDPTIGGGRYHNMKDLMRFPAKRPDLLFEVMEPHAHPVLDAERKPMLDIIRHRDLLLTYPYQSFDHVIRLLREAAIDPRVHTIKIMLYRVADRSQVVNALLNAANNGKRVVAVVELQARFDEHRNIDNSRRLREVGAKVYYGLPPVKVHSKLMLIESNGARCAGMSTGNLNETTARLYVDSILFTSHKEMTDDVAKVFDYFEGMDADLTLPTPTFNRLLVSPFNTRKALYKRIARERDKGKDGYILIKANHLTDANMVERLRRAADAGVRIHLIIRTTYAVTPHKKIKAISILDRFLEHQRIYVFGKGDDAEVFMSSADLMERNLDWRVEAAFPVLDPALRRQVLDMVQLQITDDCKARRLDRRQANKYVRDGRGNHRAQYETWAYHRELQQDKPQA